MKVIFLDIDGVLNGHERNKDTQHCGIRSDCAARLNTVLLATDAKIVLTSAWRYMIHRGDMTIFGFQNLLKTHGVLGEHLIDITVRDELIRCREDQIVSWMKIYPVESFCVIDDLELELPETRFVRTDGEVGLTYNDGIKVQQALELSIR